MSAESKLPDLFAASYVVVDQGRVAIERLFLEISSGPSPTSPAAGDEAFDDATWLPGGGKAPLAITTQLLSGAGAVLGDLGLLVEARTGVVSATPLARYIVEHIAEVLWLLEPGTYTDDEDDPTAGLTDSELQSLFEDQQWIRLRRAAVRTYGWTRDFENGRIRPTVGAPRPAGLPEMSPADLEKILEPHGLLPKGGKVAPSAMSVDKLARAHSWSLGADVVDDSMTNKVNTLARRFMAERGPGHAGLYAFLSTSVHPNPFAISEAGGEGRFERPASEMARLVTVAVGAFAFGLQLVSGYAGRHIEEIAMLNAMNLELRNLAAAFDAALAAADGPRAP